MNICPWDFLEYGNWVSCEERLCGWIRQPANTLSSAAYFVAAYLIRKHLRKEKSGRDLASLCLMIGFGSILAHASGARIFSVLDHFGQYALCSYILSIGIQRAQGRKCSAPAHWLFVISSALIAMLPLLFNKSLGVVIFALLGGSSILIELNNRMRFAGSWVSFDRGVIALGLGLFIYKIDSEKYVCSPSNHLIQGHSIWHLLSAFSIIYLAKFYFENPDPSTQKSSRSREKSRALGDGLP